MSEERPAYLVMCGTALGGEPDPEYAERAGPLAAKSGLTPIAMGEVGQSVEVLEGELPEGTTVVAVERFPSMDALKAFWHSDEYQSAIPFRQNAMKMNFIAAINGLTEADLAAAAAAKDGES